MSILQQRERKDEKVIILPPVVTLDDVFGRVGDVKENDNFDDIDWSCNDWTPIVRRYLSLSGNTREARTLRYSKFLEAMRAKGKSGFRMNVSRTDTERHAIAIYRLKWLLRNHTTELMIPAYNQMEDINLDKILKGPGDKERFDQLDNIKKWQYRPDLYTFATKLIEKEDGTKETIHIDRRIIEMDGGYHKKYKRMMKDEWRDHDTYQIFQDIKIIRYDVSELVPETMRPQDDASSTDLDVLRKFITGRNFFSTPDKIDTIGKRIPKNIRLDTEDAERGDYQ